MCGLMHSEFDSMITSDGHMDLFGQGLTMPTQLLTSKLYIPPLRPSLVPRPRLIQVLNEGLQMKKRLTLVPAPAGFGKTTLMVDWLKQIDVPVARLFLDEADNGLPRFLAYLAAAFPQVDEENWRISL
jgi:LuxR family transcriptional regulator, maltose regulon positive regulatory protein